MKTSLSFSILLCMTSMFLITSCEKADVQNSRIVNYDGVIIEYRSDCIDCPDLNECCCAVYLQNPGMDEAQLFLCGSSDGSENCTGAVFGDCEVNNNGGHEFDLHEFNDKERFCMLQGGSFWIHNTNTSDPAYIYISCQEDITNPQVIQVTIPANSRYFYDVNGSCELTLCIAE